MGNVLLISFHACRPSGLWGERSWGADVALEFAELVTSGYSGRVETATGMANDGLCDGGDMSESLIVDPHFSLDDSFSLPSFGGEVRRRFAGGTAIFG
jgi:hypothetical protein